MRNSVVAAALMLALAGCATNPIPDGYTGPLASIADSARPLGRDGANYFVLSRVNGQMVDNRFARITKPAGRQDPRMMPVMLERDVPARPATFTIRGRTHYRTPALDMRNDVYDVSGEVTFTPQPQRHYIVRGELNDRRSVIWIEDAATGVVMGEEVAVEGKATIGILEK